MKKEKCRPHFKIFSDYKNRKKIPKQFNDDKNVVMKALESDRMYFFSVSDRLKDDKEVVIKAINTSTYSEICYDISKRLLDDKEVAMNIIKKHKYEFCVLSNRLKKDEDILNLRDFKYSEIVDFGHIIDDTEFFLKFFKIIETKIKNDNDGKGAYNFEFSLLYNASNRIKNDKNIVKRAIEVIPESFFDASDKLKIDHEILKIFINTLNGYQIKKYFPNCFEPVPEFKSKYPYLEKYLEKIPDFIIKLNNLHKDMLKDIVILIIKNKPFLFKNLKPEFKTKDVILEGICQPVNIPDIILHISNEMKEDPDIKPLLDIKTLQYFSPQYNNDKKFVLKSVKKYNTIRFASKTLKNDKDIVYAALKNSKDPDDVLKYISPSLKNDRNIFLKAIDIKLKLKETNKMKKINENKPNKKTKKRNRSR